MRQRRRAGLMPLLLPLALGAGVAAASAAGTPPLELERELYRELHKMPPAAVFPSAETQACYDRLGKVAHFTPVPIRVEPSQCARFDMVRLDRVVMPDQTFVAGHPAAAAAMQHGRSFGRMGPRRCRARRRLAWRAACHRHRPRFLRVPRPQQHRGRQAFRARQGQRHRHRRHQAQERRHLHADRSAGVEAVSRADAHARLRPLHHGAGAGLGRLPRGAHPSRSRPALERLSDLPVECHRSGGDRRGGAVAASAPDQSHVG